MDGNRVEFIWRLQGYIVTIGNLILINIHFLMLICLLYKTQKTGLIFWFYDLCWKSYWKNNDVIMSTNYGKKKFTPRSVFNFFFFLFHKTIFATVEKFGVGTIFFPCFWKNSLTKAAFIWLKKNLTVKFWKIITIQNNCFLFEYI